MEVIAKSKLQLKNYLIDGSKSASKLWLGTKLINALCTSNIIINTLHNSNELPRIRSNWMPCTNRIKWACWTSRHATVSHLFALFCCGYRNSSLWLSRWDCSVCLVTVPTQVWSFYEFSKFKLIWQTGSRNSDLYI